MTSSAIGVGDLAERFDRGLPGLGVAVEDEHDRQRRLAVELGRDERRGRSGHEDRDRREGLRRAGRDRSEAAQDLAGRRHEQRAAEDHADRIEAELEARHHTEVATTAADGPEQVGVLLFARRDDAALGRDQLDRDERIDRQAVLAHQPADATAERQAGQADAAGVAEWRREPVGTRRRGVLASGQAGLGPGEAPLGVDVQALHAAQVEDDAALARAETGQAVRTATDRELESRVPGEDDRPRDVGGTGRLDDQRRTAIDRPIVDEAGRVEGLVLGADDGPDKASGKAGDVERGRWIVGGDAGKSHAVGSFRVGVVKGGVGGGDDPIFEASGRAASGQPPASSGRHMAGRHATHDDVRALRRTGRARDQTGGGDTPWR